MFLFTAGIWYLVFVFVMISIHGIHIIDNGNDIRLIGDETNEFCNVGRIELYNGKNWGSLADCSLQFTNVTASAVCQTLGWDRAESFHRGPYSSNVNVFAAEFITYTNIYCPIGNECDHELGGDCDICFDCQFSNHIDPNCPTEKSLDAIHNTYDIYIHCENRNKNELASQLYNCTLYDYATNDTNDDIYDGNEWNLTTFSSCADAFHHPSPTETEEDSGEGWKFLVGGGVVIVTVLCMVIYCQSVKRSKHKKFTDAYTLNFNDDDAIMMQPMGLGMLGNPM